MMKTIKNEMQYEAIVQRVNHLMEILDDDTPKTDSNYIELDILTDLVVAYEQEHYAVSQPSLIEVIKLRMYEMDVTQKKLAELLDISASRVSDLLTGKSEPTLQLARKISTQLNISADIVLGV
jgi:HTH-type transcriptional regulator/antitoxin HigA